MERLEDGEGAADEVGVLDALADGGQGVQDAAARHELEDVVVGEAEEGRAEGGEDGQAVGRVVDGAQDGGEGLHLFAGVVLLAADEAVRDAVGLERLLERADELRRHLADEQADVARARGADGVVASVADAPGPVAGDVVDEGGDGAGEDGQDGVDPPLLGLGQAVLGQGQGDGAGAFPCDLVPGRFEGTRLRVFGLPEDLVEALVDEGEDGGDGAEVGGEGQHFPTVRLDEALHLLVDGDVGPAEAVDALLGVADDEELAWRGGLGASRPRARPSGPRPGGRRSRPAAGRCPGTRPRGRSRSASGSSGGRGSTRQDVARLEEEIGEVHEGAFALQGLVAVEEAAEAVAQGPGQVGVRGRRRRLPGRPSGP